MFISKIPTLGSRLQVMPRSHRAGMWPATMGDDSGNDDVSNAGYSSTDPVSASIIATSQAAYTNTATPGLTDGVASVLAQISPGAQTGIVSAISSALGLGPKVVYAPGAYVPPSTLPKWLLPAAGAGLLLLLLMHRK